MGTVDSGGLGIPESSLNLLFGFDNAKYSDMTLLLQIVDHATTEPLVKTIRVNSLILASRSSYFRKLLSTNVTNDMLESHQKNVTIQIETSGEAPIMDLLKYVYSNTLPATLKALLDLLVIADKFKVPSCLRDCNRALRKLPMTCESASLYLELPPTLLMYSQVQTLTDTAKHFLVSKFKDLDRFTEEVLNLPLLAFQALLSSDELEVTSECVVYNFVLKWVHKHYPLDLEERREILKTYLLHLIRFPFMTTTELTEQVQNCIDIDCEVSSKIVIRALAFKAETPHRKRSLVAEEGNSTASRQFVERAYKREPINVIELALPYKQCIVYLHFKRENLIHLIPEGRIESETFYLGEQKLVLVGRCSVNPVSKIQFFWLALEVVGSASCSVNYEIQLKMNPSKEFISWARGSHTFTELERTKYIKNVTWRQFMGGNNTYFINNSLYVRAELTTND